MKKIGQFFHKIKHFLWVLFIILGKLPTTTVLVDNGVLVYRKYKDKTKFMFAMPLSAFEYLKRVV